MKTTLIGIMDFKTAIFGAVLAASMILNPLAQGAEKAGAQVRIPAGSAEIWQAIDKEVEQLAALIQAGKFEKVHHHAFAIRDLAAALPARSGSLPADKLAQVKTDNKFVATLAERLDTTGDAKDKLETESNFQKLKTVLTTVRANYPDSTGK